MVYTLLIVGLKERDAGKTHLALSSLAYLREKGFNAVGFKPRAGNSLWYNYAAVREALSKGRLYGEDANLLKIASDFGSESGVVEELINPLHRLWIEPSLITPHHIPHFILDRVTLWREEVMSNLVVVNKMLPQKYIYDHSIFRKLFGKATKIYHVQNLKQLNLLTERYYDLSIELAYQKLVEQNDCMIIESYGDIALPWTGLKELTTVVGIKPWTIAIYEAKKYLAGVQLLASTHLTGELPTYKLFDLVKPIREIAVHPCKSEEIVSELKEIIPIILQA